MRMKSTTKAVVTIFFFIGIICFHMISALGQKEPEDTRIKTLLNNHGELSNNKDKGYRSEYTGKLRRIPDELETELKENFPEYMFFIAQMNVLIDLPERKYDLIVITDATITEIKGFVWGNYWMIRPSRSFELILKGRKAKSEKEAISQAESLARLITIANNDKLGKTKFKNGRIKVEMIRGEGVLGVLSVLIDKNFVFQKLTITRPNGKSLRYFV